MKLANMAWVLGALSAVSLGMAAQACSSSNTANGTGAGANCTLLSACCTSLAGTTEAGTITQCTALAGEGPDGSCAAQLTSYQSAGFCKGGSTGTGVGSTGVGTGVGGTGTGVGGTGTGVGGTGTGVGSTGTGSGSCEKPPALYAETAAGVYCPFSVAAGTGGGAATCTAGQHCCEPASGTSTCTAAGTACTAGDTDWECEGPLDCAGSAGGAVCCGTGTVGNQVACGIYPAFSYGSMFTGSTCAASCSTYVICSKQTECATGTCTAIKAKGNSFGYCATGVGSGT